MKYFLQGLLMIFCVQITYAQDFTIDDLFTYAYYPQSVEGGTSMKDGKHYTLLTNSGIEKYSYRTFQKVETIKKGKYKERDCFNTAFITLLGSGGQQKTKSNPAKRDLQQMTASGLFFVVVVISIRDVPRMCRYFKFALRCGTYLRGNIHLVCKK